MNFNKPKPRRTNMLQSSDKYNRSYYNQEKPGKKIKKNKSFTLATDSRSVSRKKKRKMRISNTARSFVKDLKQLEGPSISNSGNRGDKVKLKPWPIIHLAEEQLVKLDQEKAGNGVMAYEMTEENVAIDLPGMGKPKVCKWNRPRGSPREKRMKKCEYESSKLRSRRKERKMKKFDDKVDIDLESISSDINSLKEDLFGSEMTRLEKIRRQRRKKKKKIIGAKQVKRAKQEKLDLKKRELGKMDLESIDNASVDFKKILEKAKQEERREEMREAREKERDRRKRQMVIEEERKQREVERKRQLEIKKKKEEERRKMRKKMKKRSQELTAALDNFDLDIKSKMFSYKSEASSSNRSFSSAKKMCIEKVCNQMSSEIKKVMQTTGKKIEGGRKGYSAMKVKRNIWRVFPNCVGCEIIDNRARCVACRVGMGLNLDKPVEQRDCTPCQLRSCQCTDNYKICTKCAFNATENATKTASSQFGKVCDAGNPPDYNKNNLISSILRTGYAITGALGLNLIVR